MEKSIYNAVLSFFFFFYTMQHSRIHFITKLSSDHKAMGYKTDYSFVCKRLEWRHANNISSIRLQLYWSLIAADLHIIPQILEI